MNDHVLEYQAPLPTSRWAVGVFCAALGAAVVFFLIVPAIVVLVVAIVVQGNLARRMEVRGQRLASLATAISAVAVTVGVVMMVFTPCLCGGSRELANRSTCAANLRGITQSMNVYAADNAGWYPIVGASYTSTLAAALPGTPAPADTLLSSKPGGLYTGTMPGNVSQNMWLLVLSGQVAAKQFLCKSDPAGGPAAPATVPATTDFYANFTAGPHGNTADADLTYSYSFAFMWTAAGKVGDWWKSDTDAGLPLIADIAPANGTGPATARANTLDGANKLANSLNHNRDGQNVGFGDGHAEFTRLANAGHSSDNIYSANGAAGPTPTGTTPSSAADPHIAGGKKGDWDVILVPAADVSTNVRK